MFLFYFRVFALNTNIIQNRYEAGRKRANSYDRWRFMEDGPISALINSVGVFKYKVIMVGKY